jgi:hypothetical protein
MSLQYQSLVDKVAQWQVDGVISAQTTITGHSLGGYLAAAVKSYYSSSFGAAYTFNAPGVGSALGSVTQFFQSAFGLTPNLTDVYDLRGTTGLSFIAGLGMHMGTSVPVEIESAPGFGLGNHSIGRINQSLAVLAAFAKLDTTLNLQQGICSPWRQAPRRTTPLKNYCMASTACSRQTPMPQRQAMIKTFTLASTNCKPIRSLPPSQAKSP